MGEYSVKAMAIKLGVKDVEDAHFSNKGETLTYIGWLACLHMAGIRLAHLKSGFVVPPLKPEIVRAIIEGAAQS
jgi:hypothetical protein